jgi:hypothetical protein
MLAYGVVLLCDVHLHTDAHTRALLEHFDLELFDHHPYSPVLDPSDSPVYLPEELDRITALRQ